MAFCCRYYYVTFVYTAILPKNIVTALFGAVLRRSATPRLQQGITSGVARDNTKKAYERYVTTLIMTRQSVLQSRQNTGITSRTYVIAIVYIANIDITLAIGTANTITYCIFEDMA